MAPNNPSTSLVSLVELHNSRTQEGPNLKNKPLPQLPRGWTRIYYEASLFLRAVGLGILVSTWSGFFHRDFVEPPKVAVRQNRWTALLRALIHVVPIGVSLTEIVWNCKGYYYGDRFTRLAYYQIIAKVHEVTVQASLASIVLSYLRHQITRGQGLPFGIFLGGMQFPQVSYLWSPELWASLFAKQIQLRVRLALAALLLVSGVLATTVGPSSATLLIPREIVWPIGVSHFSINGSFQDIWPGRLDGSTVPQNCSVLQATETSSPCPGGVWAQLAPLLDQSELSIKNHQSNDTSAQVTFTPRVAATKSGIAMLCSSGSQKQVCATSLQDVIVETAALAYLEWYNTFAWPKGFVQELDTVSQGYYQPYVLGNCAAVPVNDTNQETAISFPRLSENKSEFIGDEVLVPVPNFTYGELLKIPGNRSEFRLSWMELPQDPFDDGAIGAILLHPQLSNPEASVNVSLCTLSSGWGASAILTSSTSSAVYFSTIEDIPTSWLIDSNVFFGNTMTSDTPDYANLSGSALPPRRISITTDWAKFLNPVVIFTETYNSTAIHHLLTGDHLLEAQYQGTGITRVLSLMMAYGLAVNGIGLGHISNENEATRCKNCLKFNLDHVLHGYGYNSQGPPTRWAIAVMCAYCLIASAHILYLGISGISSTAWDSTAEMMTLAVNSAPTEHLQNTCAGIIGIKTFQTSVRVLARDSGDGQQDHLELVFGEFQRPDACMRMVEVNRKYGKVRVE